LIATASSGETVFRTDFERQEGGPEWLERLRRVAFERFEALGYPTTKNEDWHFTSVAPIAERSFSLSDPNAGVGIRLEARASGRRESDVAAALGLSLPEIARFKLGHDDWHTLLFLNGELITGLSDSGDLPTGIKVTSLAGAIDSSTNLQEQLGSIARFEQHAFTALNTAFIRDGVYIELQKNVVVDKPIHLVFVSRGVGVAHPRNLVVAGRHSRATIIESYVAAEDSSYFTNAVTEIALAEGAHVDHYKLQRESERAFHIGTVQARQERSSRLHSFSFAVGGALARTNVYTTLAGDAATCTLNGLYLTDGTQHIDNQTSIEHIAPNCPSHEVYKGVLDGRSHGVFNGKVYVHPEAQKTDGKQSNNNLLLSPTARIDTKPQLEIFADDVKCTHGATVGRLDDVAMFYLNSRGIGPETARMLLTYAFAADVLETIELEPLKEELERIVLSRFADSQR
jgi:Fe-S cluster assembly protein SufD